MIGRRSILGLFGGLFAAPAAAEVASMAPAQMQPEIGALGHSSPLADGAAKAWQSLIRRRERSRTTYLDHDIAAMRSWSASTKARVQTERDEAQARAFRRLWLPVMGEKAWPWHWE